VYDSFILVSKWVFSIVGDVYMVVIRPLAHAIRTCHHGLPPAALRVNERMNEESDTQLRVMVAGSKKKKKCGVIASSM
jgi:hypothetical protein